MDDHWGWRQTLTWKVGFRRAKAGRPYSCPWWADEQVYGLAYLQGKGVEIPRPNDPNNGSIRDTEAIGRLGELMEQYPLHVLDTSLLPMSKPQLKAVLKEFWRAAPPAQKRALEVGYIGLANFQDGVGSKPIGLTLSDDSVDTAIAWMKRTSEERVLLFEEFVTFRQAVK